MVHLFFFCLASVGLTVILVDGTVFLPLRRYFADEATKIRRHRERKNLSPSFSLFETIHEILSCHQCCGFWAGLFCSPYLLTSEPFRGAWPVNNLFTVFFCGLTTSLLAIFYLRGVDYVFSYAALANRTMPPSNEDVSSPPESEPDEGQNVGDIDLVKHP